MIAAPQPQAPQQGLPMNVTGQTPPPQAAPIAPPPSLADLTRMMGMLIQQSQALTTSVQTLINNPQSTRNERSVVEKPQPFKGNGSEHARVFWSAFIIYARNHEREFGVNDVNGRPLFDVHNQRVLNQTKLITSFLTFMQDEAAVWARPQLEMLAENRVIYNDNFYDLLTAFKLKFEPLQADMEARSKIAKMSQGNRSFTAFIAEFETWSPRTGWSDTDLFSRLYEKLSPDYIERISYMPQPPTTYAELKKAGSAVDVQKQNLAAALDAQRGGSSGKSTISQPSSSAPRNTGFAQPADPNAMDISASVDFSGLAGLTDRNKIRSAWQKAMKGRCSVCGAKNHASDKHQKPSACNHCGKSGHWAAVCLARLTGAPKAQNVSASVSGAVDPEEFSAAARATGQNEAARVPASSKGKERASDDQGAELAALRDTVALQSKQLADMMARLSASF